MMLVHKELYLTSMINIMSIFLYYSVYCIIIRILHLVSTLWPAHPTQLLGDDLPIEREVSTFSDQNVTRQAWRGTYPGEVDGGVIAGPFWWSRGHWSLTQSWVHWGALPVRALNFICFSGIDCL